MDQERLAGKDLAVDMPMGSGKGIEKEPRVGCTVVAVGRVRMEGNIEGCRTRVAHFVGRQVEHN